MIIDEIDARVLAVEILTKSNDWFMPYAHFRVTEYDYHAGFVYIKEDDGREFEIQVIATGVR